MTNDDYDDDHSLNWKKKRTANNLCVSLQSQKRTERIYSDLLSDEILLLAKEKNNSRFFSIRTHSTSSCSSFLSVLLSLIKCNYMSKTLVLFLLLMFINFHVGKYLIFSLISLIIRFKQLECLTEQQLIRKLLQYYEPSVRPVINAQAVVTISFRMEITQLFELVKILFENFV